MRRNLVFVAVLACTGAWIASYAFAQRQSRPGLFDELGRTIFGPFLTEDPPSRKANQKPASGPQAGQSRDQSASVRVARDQSASARASRGPSASARATASKAGQ